MREFDLAYFFFNLKIVAATGTTSINRIRVKDASASAITKVIYQMSVARGNGGGGGGWAVTEFQPYLSHMHTSLSLKFYGI